MFNHYQFDNITISIIKVWLVNISTIICTSLLPEHRALVSINDSLALFSPIILFLLKVAALVIGMIYTVKSYRVEKKTSHDLQEDRELEQGNNKTNN